jgi:hypothetical protein
MNQERAIVAALSVAAMLARAEAYSALDGRMPSQATTWPTPTRVTGAAVSGAP